MLPLFILFSNYLKNFDYNVPVGRLFSKKQDIRLTKKKCFTRKHFFGEEI
jgi:hypothetical protein